MLTWIILGGAAALFAGFAVKGATTSTADKVEPGDSVFVPVTALATVDPASTALLQGFLAGFTSATVKITGVIPDGKGNAIGSIVGLTAPVRFALASVVKIERNGTQFT